MTADGKTLWLAPLRGVTIRTFRRVFAVAIREAGFDAAVAPFIPANPGLRIGRRLLADLADGFDPAFPLVPQVIGKHPEPLREMLKALKDLGFPEVDLNAGCPFPMIRNKGRGAGLLRVPDTLERLLAVGCDTLGDGRFSLKTRLGFAAPDELARLMPRLNRYPLARLTVHARTATEMYGGAIHAEAFAVVAGMAAMPVVRNGDAETADPAHATGGLMVGRAFIRGLGRRADAATLAQAYLEASRAELCGDAPALGRMKELLAYWAQGDSRWRRRWDSVKICRTVGELETLLRF